MPTQNNRSLYSDLVNHYNLRRDKSSLCRVWTSGWSVGLDGDTIVVGGSEWVKQGKMYKRTWVKHPIVRVSPDSVVKFDPSIDQVQRHHANVMMEVLGKWKGNVHSQFSDLRHVGPVLVASIDGARVGLDPEFSYQGWRYVDGSHERGRVISQTPITRRTTNRKRARYAYRLSKEIAKVAVLAERFVDRSGHSGWEKVREAKDQMPAVVKQLHEAAGGTFDLKVDDHTDLVAKLAEYVACLGYYNLGYQERSERTPATYDRIAAYGRMKLLHQMKLLDGYEVA